MQRKQDMQCLMHATAVHLGKSTSAYASECMLLNLPMQVGAMQTLSSAPCPAMLPCCLTV